MTHWEVVEDYSSLSRLAASILLDAIAENRSIRLGLPTGSTPVGTYQRVVQFCRSNYHCFRDVVAFNLDEYVGLHRDDPESYYSFMRQHLYDHVDIQPRNTHVPCGDPNRLTQIHSAELEDALAAECRHYEQRIETAGGIDLMFLGLGSNGHIAFNEPGTSFESRTHVIELDRSTIEANARFFPDGGVPRLAITMGIRTILSSRRIVLLASGTGKRDAIDVLRSGKISEAIPASALHTHSDVMIICDRSAAGDG